MPQMTRNSGQRWEKGFCIHNWTVEEMEMLISMKMVGRERGCSSQHETIHVAQPAPHKGFAAMMALLTLRNKPIAYGIPS